MIGGVNVLMLTDKKDFSKPIEKPTSKKSKIVKFHNNDNNNFMIIIN